MSTACQWGYCLNKILRLKNTPSSVVHKDDNRWQTIFIEYFLYVYGNRQAVDGHVCYSSGAMTEDNAEAWSHCNVILKLGDNWLFQLCSFQHTCNDLETPILHHVLLLDPLVEWAIVKSKRGIIMGFFFPAKQ